MTTHDKRSSFAAILRLPQGACVGSSPVSQFSPRKTVPNDPLPTGSPFFQRPGLGFAAACSARVYSCRSTWQALSRRPRAASCARFRIDSSLPERGPVLLPAWLLSAACTRPFLNKDPCPLLVCPLLLRRSSSARDSLPKVIPMHYVPGDSAAVLLCMPGCTDWRAVQHRLQSVHQHHGASPDQTVQHVGDIRVHASCVLQW